MAGGKTVFVWPELDRETVWIRMHALILAELDRSPRLQFACFCLQPLTGTAPTMPSINSVNILVAVFLLVSGNNRRSSPLSQQLSLLFVCLSAGHRHIPSSVWGLSDWG